MEISLTLKWGLQCVAKKVLGGYSNIQKLANTVRKEIPFRDVKVNEIFMSGVSHFQRVPAFLCGGYVFNAINIKSIQNAEHFKDGVMVTVFRNGEENDKA